MSKKSDDKKNIVVVGGGYAGIHVVNYTAKKLDHSKYNIILVNPRPYYIHLIAALRMTVTSEGKLEDTALIPYDRLPCTFVQAKVTTIQETAPGKGGVLVLDNGEQLDYAVLVLGTGSLWKGLPDFGDTEKEVKDHIRAWREKFSKARNVVIVGGGAVGIETAGEIRDVYPDKKITIVHGQSELLNDTYPTKFRKSIEDKVRQRNIDILFNDYVDAFPEDGLTTDLTTRNGKVLKGTDLVIPAFGPKPNTAFIESLGSGVLTSSGYVKVKPTLELQDHPGVYAVGDIIDFPEQKQAGKVMSHAGVVQANLMSFLDGKPQTSQYKGPFAEAIVIPVGAQYGAGYIGIWWGIMLGNWATRLIKGKTLLIPAVRGKFFY